MRLIVSQDGKSARVVDDGGGVNLDWIPVELVQGAPCLLMSAAALIRRMTHEEQKRPAARVLRDIVLTVCENAGIDPEDLESMERVAGLWPDEGTRH